MGLFAWIKEQRDFSDLEEQVRKLVRIVEARDLDWVDMRARCKRLLDRTEKAQRALNPDVDSEQDVPQANGGGADIATTGGRLSDRQKQIQQLILRRRAGG
jgi:hypothetical protein